MYNLQISLCELVSLSRSGILTKHDNSRSMKFPLGLEFALSATILVEHNSSCAKHNNSHSMQLPLGLELRLACFS